MYPLILFYVVLTIVRPQDYLPGLVGVPLLPVVLVLSFLLWCTGARKSLDAPQFFLLPTFLLILMISEVTSGWAGGTIDQFAKFAPAVIAFFVLASACHTQKRVAIAMAAIVLSACVLALHGVEQHQTGIGWTGVVPAEDGRIQYVGIFNDPNDLGLLFAAALPFAMYLSRFGGVPGRLFWLSAATLLLYGTYLTNSRGAMLAVLMVAGVFVWRKRGMVTAGLLGVGGLACMKLLSSRMQELDAEEESASGRVDAWYAGLHMFTSHPVFGVGAGNFTEYNDLTAHNSFVLVLAETGFVGFLIWLAFVVYTFAMMAAILRLNPVEGEDATMLKREQALALTLLLSLVGLFTAAFFLSRSYMIVLYLFAALATGLYIGARQRCPALPGYRFAQNLLRWVPATMGGIASLFVLVAVLLHTA